MPTDNKYEDISAIKALKLVSDKTILLPDIQREYVWDIADIERLFESIVDGYPIGACIFWKTTRKTINQEKPNLYYFVREFRRGETKNEKAPEVFSDESDYYIVLDGQQRITSLNIALYGSYTYFKSGKGRRKNNPKFWVTKELYYNLDYYDLCEEDSEYPSKRFCFLTAEEAVEGNYFKVKQILAYDELQDFLEYAMNAKMTKKCRTDLSVLFNRLHDSSGTGLIHYYCIAENSYDEALDIFVRVNSTGKKLSKSDLLFSTLIDGWKLGKDNIEKLLDIMNNKGDQFNFSRDYLMRLCLVLVDANTNLKINSLTRETILKVRESWAKIDYALDSMTDVLAEIGVSDEYLTSYNATMPIAYYIFKGGEIESAESKKEVRKFLSVSLAKRLFGVASNEALNATRNALKDIDCKKTPFKLDLFSEITLTGGRKFIVSEADIDFWLDTYEKGPNTYIILSLLYPDLKLSQVSFHQDHCHPYISFESQNLQHIHIPKDKIENWQKKRNLLPNLQFLEGAENESKNKTPLKDWVAQGHDFAYHPAGVSLELADFDVFFEERRKLIKEKLINIFEISNKYRERIS